VIECHHRRSEADTTVGANWAVLGEQPHARLQIRSAACRVRRERGRRSGGPWASAAARRTRARRGRGGDVMTSARTRRAGRRGGLTSGPIWRGAGRRV